MKYPIWVLFGLITISAVVVALIVGVLNARKQRAQRHEVFLAFNMRLNSIEGQLGDFISEIPQVASELKELSPADPIGALSYSVDPHFVDYGGRTLTSRRYTFGWQAPDGNHIDRIEFSVFAKLNHQEFPIQHVKLTCAPTKLNGLVTDWYCKQIEQDKNVRITKIELNK